VITAVMPTYRSQGRRVRTRRTQLSLRDGRPTLLGLYLRHRRERAGPLPPTLVKLWPNGAKLWHTSNLFRVGNGEKLAQRLVENSFADRCSLQLGAEHRGGIKLIRKYSVHERPAKRYKIICFQAAFHGRLLNALAATATRNIRRLRPRPPATACGRSTTPTSCATWWRRDRRHPGPSRSRRRRHPVPRPRSS